MITMPITYENFEGTRVTENFHFHLSKLEILEMELKYPDGFEEYLTRISNSTNPKEIYYAFKDIVLASYGEKTDDGKHFVKNQAIADGFASSEAMSELIYSFLEDVQKALTFINGIFPKKMMEEARAAAGSEDPLTEMAKQQTVELPTAPPVLETAKDEPTDEELLKMSPQDMSQAQLMRAYQIKTRSPQNSE